MRTILYLGIDKRSAEFAAAVVGQAAVDETVHIFGADAHRSDEINRYGLRDIPCLARLGTITEGDGEEAVQREVCVYQTSDPAALPGFHGAADAAAAEIGAV